MQVQELVEIVPWTFVAQICNLFLQMYLIKRFLFQPVNNILQKRKELADGQLLEAAKTREEASALKTEYEQNLLQAKKEAKEIMTEAQRSSLQKSEEILKTAEQEAREMKERAEMEIAREKKKAVSEAKTELGTMAVELAGKVLHREVRQEDHEKLIDAFITNIEEAS